jgi:hypothetical protein
MTNFSGNIKPLDDENNRYFSNNNRCKTTHRQFPLFKNIIPVFQANQLFRIKHSYLIPQKQVNIEKNR